MDRPRGDLSQANETGSSVGDSQRPSRSGFPEGVKYVPLHIEAGEADGRKKVRAGSSPGCLRRLEALNVEVVGALFGMPKVVVHLELHPVACRAPKRLLQADSHLR